MIQTWNSWKRKETVKKHTKECTEGYKCHSLPLDSASSFPPYEEIGVNKVNKGQGTPESGWALLMALV